MDFVGREDDPTDAAAGVDLCVIATPDAAIAATAARVATAESAVVAHLSGALGLGVLAPHPRRGCLHPLVSLPDARTGAAALTAGAWFAVAGDPLVRVVVADLGGRLVEVTDAQRVAYHAAACIASNHLVAVLAQAQGVASGAGLPVEMYLDLARATLDNVAAVGPVLALTGPAARGDWPTIEAHVGVLDPHEVPSYLSLADAAARLAGHDGLPPSLAELAQGSAPCS